MKKLLALIAVVAAVWFYSYDPPARWRGLPAAKDPVQTSARLPAPFKHDQYTVTPLATYSVTAVVLSRERYRNDVNARLSPVDLALGWGPMSAAVVLNDLSISQSGRWYNYSWRNEAPLELADIINHSANTHCLPADDEVRRQLLEVKRHELVTLEGYLVEVRGDDGYRWRSSLTRTDSAGGACEVMWITKVSHRRI